LFDQRFRIGVGRCQKVQATASRIK
jgi:hypothetical protein